MGKATATDTITRITIMTESEERIAGSQQALIKLMTWLSPAFPVGAFAYSHGIERAVHDGLIADRGNLEAWLGDLITIGSGWNDAVLTAAAHRAVGEGADLTDLAALGESLAGSAERHLETMAQGRAFCEAAAPWMESVSIPRDCPFPIALGAVASANGLRLEDTLTASLHAFASNLVQAAVRLVPLGQRDGVAAIAALAPVIAATARRAALSTIDDLGSATFASEIASLNHETQYSRLFRS